MPQPTKGDVHVNRPLTNISIAFLQDRAKFVSDMIFPQVPVKKQGDKYFVYRKSDWFRSEARKRAPGTESAGTGFNIDQDSYFADVFALHKDLDDQTRANQDEPINLDRDATEFLSRLMWLKKEKEFVADFFTTSIWTGSTTGGDITPGTLWDAAGSDPVNDIDLEMDAQEEKTGFRPNLLLVGPKVHTALKSNAAILDRIKHTQRATPTPEILASLFEVDKYMVARATENTAAEGATPVFANLFGNDALLTFSQPSPGILKPSAGYQFVWSGLFGAGQQGTRMKSFRMEELASDRIEIEATWDMKQVAADLGVFFLNVTS